MDGLRSMAHEIEQDLQNQKNWAVRSLGMVTLHPEPCTLNPEPCTLNPAP